MTISTRWRVPFLCLGAALALSAAEPPVAPPLPAPTGLAARSGGNAEVALTWTASPGAAGYEVYRSTTQNDTNARQVAAHVIGTAYTSAGLRNDTTYYFRVKATNAAGASGFSGEVSATTLITRSPLPDGVYTLAPKNSPDLRLQATGLDNGTKVTVEMESASPTQRWRLTSLDKATYRVTPVSAPAQALAAVGKSRKNGAVVQTWTYRGRADQKWTLTPATGGYRLTPAHAATLALNASGPANGSAVNQLVAADTSAQVWNILPVSESAPDPGTAYVPAGYKLVFSDEFDGAAIDTAKWETLAPYSQPHLNDEIECYHPGGVIVANGLCILRAEEMETVCGVPHTWRSGAITSRSTRSHGYYEARIKVPQGPGLWPAFWLTSSKRWPPEWDILEIPYPVGTLYQYMHPTKEAKTTWVQGIEGSDSIYSIAEGMPNPYSGFVIYGCESTKQGVKLWVNGKLTAQWDISDDTTDEMWVSLNLAVGGKWPGPPDATTPRPANMYIDYVRVYQPASDR